MRYFLLLFTFISSAAATLVITSVTPNVSPVAPGTVVTIRGSGFSNCPICSPPIPPSVAFGGTRARSVQLIDEKTLIAVTPAHLPTTVNVTVSQFDGFFTLRDAFTFTGEPSDGFETLLVPIYSPPVHGAFGSEFRTMLRGSNKADQQQVFLYGVDYGCLLISPLPNPLTDPTILDETGRTRELTVDCSTWPGRFLYVPKEQASSLTLNERVLDVSRIAVNHGTEIPIVRSKDITSARIALLGGLIDPRFRNTLRVFSTTAGVVTVKLNEKIFQMTLQPGRTIFEPAYAAFTNFPRPEELPAGSDGTIRVTVDPPPSPIPIWAFITVTNNDTQAITSITPD